MSLLSLNVIKASIILFLVGGIVLAVVKDLKKVLFAKKKFFFLYLLILIVLFGIAGLLTRRNIIGETLVSNNILIQIWIVTAGVIHLWAGNSMFKWDENNKKIPFFIFTFVAAIIGSIIFLNAVRFLGLKGLQFFFWTNFILFFAPFVLQLLIESVLAIPSPIFEKWYYPDKKKMSRPEKDELRNPILISLELEKYPGGPKSKIKAKAPENMTFGKFFYHFINDYNLRNPESPIPVHDENGNVFGWGFYVRSGFLRGMRAVNTEHTILHNRFNEDLVVFCERLEE